MEREMSRSCWQRMVWNRWMQNWTWHCINLSLYLSVSNIEGLNPQPIILQLLDPQNVIHQSNCTLPQQAKKLFLTAESASCQSVSIFAKPRLQQSASGSTIRQLSYSLLMANPGFHHLITTVCSCCWFLKCWWTDSCLNNCRQQGLSLDLHLHQNWLPQFRSNSIIPGTLYWTCQN